MKAFCSLLSLILADKNVVFQSRPRLYLTVSQPILTNKEDYSWPLINQISDTVKAKEVAWYMLNYFYKNQALLSSQPT
jgi:hypothetical protein